MRKFICRLFVIMIAAEYPAASQAVSEEHIALEKKKLKQSYDRGMRRCREYGTKDCKRYVRERYQKRMKRLNSDPELYFYSK